MTSLALVATLAVTAACSDDSSDTTASSSTNAAVPVVDLSPEATSAVLTGMADDAIVPAYADLLEALEAYGSDLEAFCEAPDAAGLEGTQDAWRAAIAAWQRARAGGVGPAMDRRLMADVAFVARPDPIERLLGGDEPLDTESLRAKGSTYRGLYVAEHLLFGESAEAIVASTAPRSCELMVGGLPLSVEAVTAVHSDWTEGDAPYRDAFAAGAEGDPMASVDAITNQLISGLTAIDDNGIRDLVMADSLEDAQESRRDGPGADLLDQYRALLAGVAQIIEGSPEVEGDGLVDLVAARSAETGESLTAATEAAVAAMADLPASADEAYTDHHDALSAASDAVAALKVLLTTQVASQLGITIRFSDADGDS